MATVLITDPVAVLLAEHLEAESRFAVFESAMNALDAGDPASVARATGATRELLGYLETDLERHILKEEEPLFPRIEARLPEDDRLIGEMVAEHDQVRLRAGQLRAAAIHLREHDHAEVREARHHLRGTLAGEFPDLAALQRIGSTLLRTLRVHFQNEEEIVFPLASELLSRSELEEAAREMAAIDAWAEQGWVQDGATVAAQPVASPAAGTPLVPDLLALSGELRESAATAREGRTARTLLKDGRLSVVLVVLRAGARIKEHTAPGTLTVQALRGSVDLDAGDNSVRLGAGGLLTFPPRVPHQVTALEDSALLLTFTTGTD